MRNSIFISLAFLFLNISLQANTISLTEALEKAYVMVTASGEGGHTGRCLKLKIKNATKKKLEILIPAGLVFNSDDPGYQDLMTIEDKTLIVEVDKPRITKMYAACIQAPNGSPSADSKFNISSLASSFLLQIAQYIATEKLYDHAAAQYAVWAISNDKRVENIDHKKLANYTADLLGKKRPEYVVVQRSTSLPGEPAYQEAPSIIKGRWRFTTEEDKKMTFGLFTKEGEMKLAFFENVKKIRGLHKFSFQFKVFNLPQGTYYIRLVSEGEVVEEKEVEF